MPTRIVFFGSPDYAVPSLRACLALPDAEGVAVVTQPDRPRGRSTWIHARQNKLYRSRRRLIPQIRAYSRDRHGPTSAR